MKMTVLLVINVPQKLNLQQINATLWAGSFSLSFFLIRENAFSWTKPNFANTDTQKQTGYVANKKHLFYWRHRGSHQNTPLRGTKSITKTQFGFEKYIQLGVSLLRSVCVDWCVCVCVWDALCVRVQEWVRQSKLFIQVRWPATHYGDKKKRKDWRQHTTWITAAKAVNSLKGLIFAVK